VNDLTLEDLNAMRCVRHRYYHKQEFSIKVHFLSIHPMLLLRGKVEMGLTIATGKRCEISNKFFASLIKISLSSIVFGNLSNY
jgi:hypothetical protein